jgi:hypothetical protein
MSNAEASVQSDAEHPLLGRFHCYFNFKDGRHPDASSCAYHFRFRIGFDVSVKCVSDIAFPMAASGIYPEKN